jgi:hypothetical protein
MHCYSTSEKIYHAAWIDDGGTEKRQKTQYLLFFLPPKHSFCLLENNFKGTGSRDRILIFDKNEKF